MPKVLIAFSSKTGVTADVAAMIANVLCVPCDRYDLDREGFWSDAGANSIAKSPVNAEDYPIIILGTAMYYGRPRKAFLLFCRQQLPALQQSKLYLYTCGMAKPEEDEAYLRKTLPPELSTAKIPLQHMGGELRLDQLSPFWRYAMKSRVEDPNLAPQIDTNAIQTFAQRIRKEL